MCGACMAICPKKCIEGKRDGQLWYADLDENTCVNCGLCKKVCSNITTPDWKKSECVYAAWDNNAEERKESASGGIAAAMYRYAIKKGMYIE
jgi:coenzyme F420-reducing hydrogenase beta subunit